MQFFLTGDVSRAVQSVQPLLEAVANTPLIMRLHPGWHMVHSCGLLLRANGAAERYEALRQSQAWVLAEAPSGAQDGCYLTPMPPLNQPLGADMCEHPLCKAVLSYVQPHIDQIESSSSSTAEQPLHQHQQPGDAGEEEAGCC